jgi:hypothetical protein
MSGALIRQSSAPDLRLLQKTSKRINFLAQSARRVDVSDDDVSLEGLTSDDESELLQLHLFSAALPLLRRDKPKMAKAVLSWHCLHSSFTTTILLRLLTLLLVDYYYYYYYYYY